MRTVQVPAVNKVGQRAKTEVGLKGGATKLVTIEVVKTMLRRTQNAEDSQEVHQRKSLTAVKAHEASPRRNLKARRDRVASLEVVRVESIQAAKVQRQALGDLVKDQDIWKRKQRKVRQ